MANLAYIRVSTKEQNTDRQEIALAEYHIDKIFTEKISGKDTNRPKLQEMLDYMRAGDVVYIESFSRLSRSLADLLRLVDLMKQKGVKLVSLKERIDTSTPQGELQLNIFGALYQFERECSKERQKEGIAARKAKGLKTGRPKKHELTPEFKELAEKNLAGDATVVDICKQLGIGRTVYYRLLGQYRAEKNIK